MIHSQELDGDLPAYREGAEVTRDESLSGSAARPGLTRAKVLSVRLNPHELAELTAYVNRLDVPASALVRGRFSATCGRRPTRHPPR